MNLFVAYSMVLIMVATIVTANRVKTYLEGKTQLSVVYELVVENPIGDEKNPNTVVEGSITVYPPEVVEYADEVGFIVLPSELIQGVNSTDKAKFPNLRSNNIVRIKGIKSIMFKDLNSSASPETDLVGGLSYAKDAYLLDVSNIKGVEPFKTYEFQATHKWNAIRNFIANTKIVRFKEKLYAQIYCPDAEQHTFELVTKIDGGENFPAMVNKEHAIGLLVTRMADA